MNRQALAFLSMFSLVLILSVYYITLPNETTITTVNETKKEETPQVENQTKINEVNKEEINTNKETIANSEAEEAEKKEAIAKVEKLEKENEIINNLIKKCKEKEWEVSIEIKDNVLKANIHNIKKDPKIANDVIMLLSKETNNAYQVEVRFI